MTPAEVAAQNSRTAEKAQFQRQLRTLLGGLGGQLVASMLGANPNVGRVLGATAARVSSEPKAVAELIQHLSDLRGKRR